MLSFFKRSPKPSGRPSRRGPAAASGRPALPEEPLPLPEVSEGNLESDWALWEDSVAFLDSQMSSAFSELDSVQDKSKRVDDHEVDPFAVVRKRDS